MRPVGKTLTCLVRRFQGKDVNVYRIPQGTYEDHINLPLYASPNC